MLLEARGGGLYGDGGGGGGGPGGTGDVSILPTSFTRLKLFCSLLLKHNYFNRIQSRLHLSSTRKERHKWHCNI